MNVSRLVGVDNPVELIYFVEDQDGERLSALKCSDLMNRVDIQRAAIILGYRIEGTVAQRKPYHIHTDATKETVTLALEIMALHSAHCCGVLFLGCCNFDTLEEINFSSLAVSYVVLLCFLKTLLNMELQQGP